MSWSRNSKSEKVSVLQRKTLVSPSRKVSILPFVTPTVDLHISQHPASHFFSKITKFLVVPPATKISFPVCYSIHHAEKSPNPDKSIIAIICPHWHLRGKVITCNPTDQSGECLPVNKTMSFKYIIHLNWKRLK